MAVVSYLAKRSLKAGVSIGQSVEFEFLCSDIQRRVKVDRSVKKAQGGLREYIKNRSEETYDITTYAVLAEDFDDFRQFLDSVDAGESYTLDPYGSIGTPVQPMLCQMDEDGYTENRVSVRYLSTSFRSFKVADTSASVGRNLISGWDVQ